MGEYLIRKSYIQNNINMKTRNLLIALILLPNIIFAQDYCPFDFENGLWEANYYSLFGSDISYLYQSQYNDYTIGDTLVNDSMLCYKLIRTGGECYNYNFDCYADIYTPFTQNLGVICEQDKRVYHNGILLYDFNAEVGDTIAHWAGILSFGVYQAPVIEEIDSVEVCGKVRRRLRTNNFTLSQIYFIEGVGSNAGLIPRYEHFEDGSRSVCYSDQNCEPCTLRYCNGDVILDSPCDDGNADTVNDVYLPDCSCLGTPVPGCGDALILEFPANH